MDMQLRHGYNGAKVKLFPLKDLVPECENLSRPGLDES